MPCGTLQANLRVLLLGGDFFLGGVIAGTLTKLMLRLRGLGSMSGVPWAWGGVLYTGAEEGALCLLCCPLHPCL